MDMPKHVGIILDGNRRWAKKRGLFSSLGHKEGAKNLKKLAHYVFEKGIPYLSVYAFSTENMKRSKDEVDYLMKLLLEYFKKEKKTFIKNKTKVVFSGTRENLREDIVEVIEDLVDATKDFEGRCFNICFNYGGRLEIVDTTKKIVDKVLSGEIDKDSITEEYFGKMLYNDLPDLDFVIRTSGEQRLSNFMLWQASYAEFYFPETLFPDFNEKEFDKALEEFGNRQRRLGK